MNQGEQLAAAKRYIRDTFWMARRYADKRCTYAPGMYNDALAAVIEAGVITIDELPSGDGTVWASDGNFDVVNQHLAKHGDTGKGAWAKP